MSPTPAMRSLWKGVDMATTLSVPGRHTNWTCTPCWMAHASIVPIATHKKPNPYPVALLAGYLDRPVTA